VPAPDVLPPTAAPGLSSARGQVLDLARSCIERGRTRGVHGTPLQYEKADIDTPLEARARGDRSEFARLSADHRLVYIPESPPFDQAMPNGIALRVNVKTRACKLLLPMR
jgi:hypothetical protein